LKKTSEEANKKKKLRRIAIEVSEELYTDYKVHCVREGTKMGEHGKYLIEEHLKNEVNRS
jgi:hypothetical protein